MAELERLADELLAKPWSPVHIEDSPFLLKASFSQAAYRLMLSDLSSVWWEEVDSDSLKQRAQELNKRLKAPASALCRHLSGLLEPLLRNGGRRLLPGFTCQRAGSGLTVSLRSELAEVPFYWAFRCVEAPLSMVSHHMVCPLLTMMQALHRQTVDLTLLLQRKDAEILDYKESGGVLSRDRLATDVFNAVEFKERFIAESLAEAVDVHDGSMFNPELQKLYTTIMAAKASRKRRHSSGEDDSQKHQPCLGEAQEVVTAETEKEEVAPAAAESPEVKKQTPRKIRSSATVSSPNRDAVKQKRKKKGIFS